jgi:hypothetical protein
MSHLFGPYSQARSRICGLVLSASDAELSSVVPACPAWNVRDLLAHVVSMPAAIAVGRQPDGEIAAWLDELIQERVGQSSEALVDEWHALDAPLNTMLDGQAALLFGDLVVHEHDLRGALGRPDHAAMDVDVMMPRTLAGFSKPLQAARLGAIEVRHEDRVWRSHSAEAGWILFVDPWTAMRAVNSRRTAAELRALPSEGDVSAYIPVLDAHLPLPAASLGE